jgi:hypothetical protein
VSTLQASHVVRIYILAVLIAGIVAVTLNLLLPPEITENPPVQEIDQSDDQADIEKDTIKGDLA